MEAEAAEAVAVGQPLPEFDLHCPLLSLPLVFRTTPRNIPARIPYVVPDPRLVAEHDRCTAGPLHPSEPHPFELCCRQYGDEVEIAGLPEGQ